MNWPDLLIEGPDAATFDAWLAPWIWLPREPGVPLCVSRFGCWFFENADGQIDMLDVFFGQMEEVAPSFEALREAADDPAWQAAYLLSELVYRLHAEGTFAAGTSCYAIAPHPAAGGPDPWESASIETKAVVVMDAPLWQGVCAQVLRASREVSP